MIKNAIIVLLVLTGISVSVNAQIYTRIVGDSVRMHSNSGTAELILENSTKGQKGFLYNKGEGRTEFRRGLVKLNDSLYLIGGDTLNSRSLSISANNGLIYDNTTRNVEFGIPFSDPFGTGSQIRPTIYNQNSQYFNWTTGYNIFTVSKFRYGGSPVETNPLVANYIARFAHQTQGGLLLESNFKGPTVYAFPSFWINFKNTHPNAVKFSFFGDSLTASIMSGTRTGTDDKVYTILDFTTESDTNLMAHSNRSALMLFPAFKAANGGPIRVPTAHVKRLDITGGVAGAMYNLTALSYDNPYSRLVIDAANNPLVVGNLPSGSGSNLVIDSTGKIWKGSGSSSGENYAIQTITDGSALNWNLANGMNGTVTLGGTGRTLNMTNAVAGHTYRLKIVQDGTGNRTITWPSSILWPSGTTPVLSTTAGSIDMLTLFYDGTNYYGEAKLLYKAQADVSLFGSDAKYGAGNLIHSLSSVPAGALLVITTACGTAMGSASITSTPSLTWTKQADAANLSSGDAEIYTAVYTAGGSISITSTWSNPTFQSSVCYVVINQEASLGGATATATQQNPPSINFTTTRANSLIFAVSSDWNAADGGGRSYRGTTTESLYQYLPGEVSVYHYYKQAASVTSYQTGLSLPTGQASGTAILEVRGK